MSRYVRFTVLVFIQPSLQPGWGVGSQIGKKVWLKLWLRVLNSCISFYLAKFFVSSNSKLELENFSALALAPQQVQLKFPAHQPFLQLPVSIYFNFQLYWFTT